MVGDSSANRSQTAGYRVAGSRPDLQAHAQPDRRHRAHQFFLWTTPKEPGTSVSNSNRGASRIAHAGLDLEDLLLQRHGASEGIHFRRPRRTRRNSSHRREDFRTEVLGLMKSQMVKNAVIVPEGSKGGFVVPRSLSRPRETEDAGRLRLSHTDLWLARPDRQSLGHRGRRERQRRALGRRRPLSRGRS